jgi:chorismate mutase/prephenate dehydratase
MRDLTELRTEIDSIDRQIVELYEKRMSVSKEVAEYKIQNGRPVLDKEREAKKIETLTATGSDEFLSHGIEELFLQIMAMSRKRQYQLMTEKGLFDARGTFTEVKKLDYSDATVVFQGAEGAYTHLALRKYFGSDVSSYNVDTWRDAMEAIKCGEADYAVLPIENSSAGIVSQNYDLLLEYDNCIVGEQIIHIRHALLGLPDADLSDITDVYSHPQSLMQCSMYLDANRQWEQHSMSNNAFAAQHVANGQDKSKAAIASTLNAELYGLKIFEEDIQDNKSNETRFIIMTGRRVYTSNSKKISLAFEAPHEIGSLYRMLSHFIYNGVNMNHIESRPIQGKNWEYRFFVDIDGNLNDAAVVNALRGLKEESINFRILGNY